MPHPHPHVWHEAARTALRAGELRTVRRLCRAHLPADPRDAQGWVLLAQALEQAGSAVDAWACYDRAWMLDPQASWAPSVHLRFEGAAKTRPSSWVERMLALSRVRVVGAVLARDEAEHLPRCLSALAPAVDSLVVVDTGSRDGTPDLARALGASVVEAAWADDFGRARDAALAALGSDGWVLWVDADEFLDPEDVHVPRAAAALFAEVEPPMLLRIVQVNHVGHEVFPNYDVTRMYPLGRGIHWKGRVHEQVVTTPEGAPRQRSAVRIRVHHWGYEPDAMQRKGTLARNVRLLRAWVRDEPTSATAWGFLGRDLFVAGEVHEAIDVLYHAERLAAEDPGYLRIGEVRSVLCEALVRQGRLEEARQVAERMRTQQPEFPSGHFWFAQIRVLESHAALQQAVDAARQAVTSAADYRGAVTVSDEVVRFLAPVAEADARRMLGDWAGALSLYRMALSVNPAHEGVLRQMAWMQQQAQQILTGPGHPHAEPGGQANLPAT